MIGYTYPKGIFYLLICNIMAETMGSGPEMDPKRTNIETKYSTNFEARTPTGDISGQLENIRAMEGLEKAIEAFEYY